MDNIKYKEPSESVTIDDFKESSNNFLKTFSKLEADDIKGDTVDEYISNKDKAYEELNNNYNIILKYMQENRTKDFNNYFDTIFNYQLKNSFEKNGIKQINLVGIEINNDSKDVTNVEQQATILLDIDGKETKYNASGLLNDLLVNRYNKSIDSMVDGNNDDTHNFHQINKILYSNKGFLIDDKTNTITSSKDIEFLKYILMGTCGAVILFSSAYAALNRKNKNELEENDNITNKTEELESDKQSSSIKL